MYIINFFGFGIRYWLCRIPSKEFKLIDEFRVNKQFNWVDIFFNLDILERFGYSDWESIHLLHEGKGWLLQNGNWLEVKKERKKQKIDVSKFIGEGYFFDIYEKIYDDTKLVKEQGYVDVVLAQIDTGLIFKFEINKEKLDLNKMKFKMNFNPLNKCFDADWVTGIVYDGVNINESKEDSLTRESKVIIL